MSKRLFVVEVSAHWGREMVVYAEDEKEARRIAEDKADPDSFDMDVSSGSVDTLDNEDGIPEDYDKTDYPDGFKDKTIGELLHPEPPTPPEPDPTEPPQVYHIRLYDHWLKVNGWRVMQDFPGMEQYHWFIHHSVSRKEGDDFLIPNWSISEASTGLGCGVTDHKTRAEAEAAFRRYFEEHPTSIGQMARVTNVKGTDKESPEYPGKGT